MSDWTAGYVADIGYTFGYYTELNPLRYKWAFLNAGLAFPEAGAACELGFGQGMSANIHAAASATQWSGTDFNPSQAGFARELATAAGSGAQLFDDTFADFSRRPELPDFDFIGLHGIWSWISDENRSVIVEFVKRKLKVGGVLYISYNTMPGWAAFAPIRHLMTQHAEVMGAPGNGVVDRINGALEFSEKLLEVKPSFVKANPIVEQRVKQLKGQNRHYLAHEYFNRDWHPMHFATMGEWLSPAKLQYACSANFLDYVDAINLSPEQQDFLNSIPDPIYRESVRDFIVNQQFRKDYWVKGARRIGQAEQGEILRHQRVILTVKPEDVSLKITGALGEAKMSEAVYAPILACLADHKPKNLGDIEAAIRPNGVTVSQLMQAATILLGAGYLSLAQGESQIQKARRSTDKLNYHLCSRARDDGESQYLASPVTGGGVQVGRFQQLFILALQQRKSRPEELAQFAWDILQRQGQRLTKEGNVLTTEEDNLAELVSIARLFLEKHAPILKALQII